MSGLLLKAFSNYTFFTEQDFSVWGHFGHDISVYEQLIAFVYLNDYIGRLNVTLAGVFQLPFEES